MNISPHNNMSKSLEDAFDCFGSDDDHDEDSFNDEGVASAVKGSRLCRETNHRRAVANEMKTGLPITSNEFEVFGTTTNVGMGVRALRRYRVGDEIMREHAVMRVPNRQAATSRQEADALHSRAVQQEFGLLSQKTQQAVLSMSNVFAHHYNEAEDDIPTQGEQSVGVYQTNSYQLAGGGMEEDAKYDQEHSGLFMTVARINHSCRPNALHYWRRDLQQTIVHAIDDIEIGEEIFTCYGPVECLGTEERRSYLDERFSFVCGCNMCMEGNEEGGDDRMRELNQLQEDIRDRMVTLVNHHSDDEASNTGADAILDSVERCLFLLKEQKLDQASGILRSVLQLGYQAAQRMPQSPHGNNRGVTRGGRQVLSHAYLSRLLLATERGEGTGSPNAIHIQQMKEKAISLR